MKTIQKIMFIDVYVNICETILTKTCSDLITYSISVNFNSISFLKNFRQYKKS